MLRSRSTFYSLYWKEDDKKSRDYTGNCDVGNKKLPTPNYIEMYPNGAVFSSGVYESA
jgi:hypothetical protein